MSSVSGAVPSLTFHAGFFVVSVFHRLDAVRSLTQVVSKDEIERATFSFPSMGRSYVLNVALEEGSLDGEVFPSCCRGGVSQKSDCSESLDV